MNKTGEKINSSFIFDDISERDMDMLFVEEFASSADFLSIFIEKIGIKSASIVSAYLSKSDIELGESDITVIIESNSYKKGLLIENKIDAVAMPEQAYRYKLRGEKGKQLKEYDDFYTFIVAPAKYLSSNSEVAKYDFQISYETILKYYEKQNSNRSYFKAEQIRFAIDKQKHGYDPIEDKRVTDFWQNYLCFQKEHYPDLYLIYKNDKKGTKAAWPRFNTVINKLYIIHKSNFGFVDLTFDGCADKLVELEDILAYVFPNYLEEGYTVQKTGKAAAIRLNAPILDFHKSFNEQINEIEKCFESIVKMNNLAKKLDSSAIKKILGFKLETNNVALENNGLSKIEFCKKYIPVLQMIKDDHELTQACMDYSVYKIHNKHNSLMRYLYHYFMKEAYESGMVVTNYREIVETAGLFEKVDNLPEKELASLSSEQILGCIAWHFRRDHFSEGSLISESIGEGHMLRMMIKYVEKTRNN